MGWEVPRRLRGQPAPRCARSKAGWAVAASWVAGLRPEKEKPEPKTQAIAECPGNRDSPYPEAFDWGGVHPEGGRATLPRLLRKRSTVNKADPTAGLSDGKDSRF